MTDAVSGCGCGCGGVGLVLSARGVVATCLRLALLEGRVWHCFLAVAQLVQLWSPCRLRTYYGRNEWLTVWLSRSKVVMREKYLEVAFDLLVVAAGAYELCSSLLGLLRIKRQPVGHGIGWHAGFEVGWERPGDAE
jgi:hypothetical protein